MSAYIHNKLIDDAALPVGTKRWVIDIGSMVDLSFRWTVLQAAAAANAATFSFCPSELDSSDPALANLDPATNPYLEIDGAASFTGGMGGNPGNVVGSAWATLGANPWQSIVVQLVCGIQIPRFTFAFGGRVGSR